MNNQALTVKLKNDLIGLPLPEAKNELDSIGVHYILETLGKHGKNNLDLDKINNPDCNKDADWRVVNIHCINPGLMDTKENQFFGNAKEDSKNMHSTEPTIIVSLIYVNDFVEYVGSE